MDESMKEGHQMAFATQKWNENQLRDCTTFFRLNDKKRAKESLMELDFDDGWYINLLDCDPTIHDFIKENIHPKYIIE